MASNDYGAEARERVVDETLELIDNLDVHQARSILRCFAIDDESFDARALETITKTVRATCERSKDDYDAFLHFPDGRVARLNREHLIKSQAMFAEAEKAAQKAAENAQKSAQASQASMNVTSPDDHSDEGYYDQQRCATDEALASDPGNPRFEDVDTERFIRGRHVTINHYYMGKGPEAQPQPEPKPAPEPEPNWPYCIRCSDYYVEEDNVMQSDGTYPCGYHTGQVINYGNNEARAFQNYGVHIAGRAWNCCRRRPNTAGCHPDFHRPAN